MGRVSQPVLPLLPDRTRSIGPSAGLLEGPDGGVVFVLGLATFTFGAADEVGRRLAAVQLVATGIATAVETADAFGVDAVTLYRWRQDFARDGVTGLVRERTGPKGPIKLTYSLAEEIRRLDSEGLSLRQIAARTAVSTATVRVALGRVPARPSRSEQGTAPAPAPVSAGDVAEDATFEDTDAEAGDVEAGDLEAGDVEAGLAVLPAPVARAAERAAARAGELIEAPVRFTEGAHLPLAGLLLALPALEATGLLAAAEAVFGALRAGFYGLRATLLTGVFLALLREPRAEGATRVNPADLGRILGLDRAPEVKTLRRKLAELAGHGRGAELQAALARAHAAARPDALGFLYLDGHVRVYTGTRPIPKTHITRMRIAGPAVEETWVGDADGDPVMVLTAPPSASLAGELRRTLPELRALVGPDRRVTVVFDRGGYSPAVFAEIVAAGFDLLTYYKGAWTRSPDADFTEVEHPADDGIATTYSLAEREIVLPIPAAPAADGVPARPASTITLRLVVRRAESGHQTPILTSRADLPGAQVAHRMAARWRQENYFKYAREHFALDALDSYADTADDPNRPVPNPAKARASAQVTTARAELAAAHADLSAAIDAATEAARRPGAGATATVDPAATRNLANAEARLAATQKASRATPAHLPLEQVRPGARLLETERKLLTHAIRLSAYNAESALARLLREHYARGQDEARALLREAFTLPGDLQITGDTLHVRLDPASAPRRSRALAALCTDLTQTETRYPGTDLKIAYSVKDCPTPT
jgi:transposase-like protein